MSRGVRWFLIGSTALLTLAGCGRGFMQYSGEREPWRREAEVACLNSGTVKESPGIVKISPIEGPGMCGAAAGIDRRCEPSGAAAALADLAATAAVRAAAIRPAAHAGRCADVD